MLIISSLLTFRVALEIDLWSALQEFLYGVLSIIIGIIMMFVINEMIFLWGLREWSMENWELWRNFKFFVDFSWFWEEILMMMWIWEVCRKFFSKIFAENLEKYFSFLRDFKKNLKNFIAKKTKHHLMLFLSPSHNYIHNKSSLIIWDWMALKYEYFYTMRLNESYIDEVNYLAQLTKMKIFCFIFWTPQQNNNKLDPIYQRKM